MVWPFGKKKEQQPEPQGPDFVGALRSVAGFVIGGQRGYFALQGLGRFGVTEEGLVEWVRSGAGRDVLSVGDWGRLAGAELGVLSGLAAAVVRELGGEEVIESSEVFDLNPPKNNQSVINQLLAQQPELTELAKLNAMLQQDQPLENQNATSFTTSNPTKTAPQSQSSTSGSSYNPDISHIKPEAKELYKQGYDRYQAGDLMGALDLWSQAINIDPRYTDAYGNRGVVYYELKRYEEAIADYTAALNLDPRYTTIYNNRGNVYKDLTQYEKAIEDYNQALKHHSHFSDAYNGRGVVYLELKQYKKAVEDLTKTIKLNPSNAFAYNNRGNAYSCLKRYEEAITDYDQALKLNPSFVNAYTGRGSIYKDLKCYERALEDFNRAIELEPSRSHSYNSRALVYSDLKRFKEAIRDYDQAVDLQPDNWKAWSNRGIAVFNTSGYSSAISNYKTGLSYINSDQELLGFAVLHHQQGLAHYHHGQTQSKSCFHFIQATQCYNTAYNLVEANPLYTTNTLKILRDWIKADRALGQSEAADQLTLNAIQRLERALQNADPQSRRVLRAEFQDFYRLNVDRLISQNNPWEALIEAEKWKSLALTWLQNPNAEPQPLSRETLQTRIQHLCPNPHTAILYWHLSPAQITTFLLRPHQDPQPFSTLTDPPHTPATKTQTNFTEWLKHYKTTYQNSRKEKEDQSSPTLLYKEGAGQVPLTQEGAGQVPLAKGDLGGSLWRDQLPQTLHHLSQILNIDTITEHLTDIQTLILIPHRDLHLLPLHALFNSPRPAGEGPGVREITHRPNLTLPIPDHTPIPNPTLLIVKNPESTNDNKPLADLPWAETEVDSLTTLYPNTTTINRANATLSTITTQIVQPYHLFHFAGHGNSDLDNPQQSCLFLNGEDTLTVETLLKLNLPAYNLVSLSACETALSNTGEFIDEFVGLPSAFLKSGTKAVLSSQWPVESFPTTLTMIEFHHRYCAGMSAAQALAEVQQWLRQLTREDLQAWLQSAYTTWPDELWQDKLRAIEAWPTEHQPYQNPYYWAAFIVTQ